MISPKVQKLAIIIVFLISVILRFYKLGEIPPSIDWDEAAIGYNAYSILKTGKDEFGESFPLAFRSFNDYKPPLYIYLTVPAVALFGLTEFAVRLPSAIFGSLTILVTYLLIKELFEVQDLTTKWLPLVTAGLLAISPWHLYFSRVGFEANIGVFLNVLGVLLFILGIKRNTWYLYFSAIVFSIGLYAYHSERVFIPLLVLGLFVIYRKQLIRYKKEVVISGIIGFIIIFPLINIVLRPQGLSRLRGTSVYSEQITLLRRSAAKLKLAKEKEDILGIVFANRRVIYVLKLVEGYLSPFNFNWLFINGDQPRHKAPGVGLLYWWELPFLLVGFYYFAKSKRNKKAKYLVSLWFLISPVPASPTTGLPHAVRTLVFLPTFQIFVAFGITSLFFLHFYPSTKSTTRTNAGMNWQDVVLWYEMFVRKRVIEGITVVKSRGLHKKKARMLLSFLYLIFMLFNVTYFFHQYFVHLPMEFSEYWQYGYKQTVDYVKGNYDKYDKIIVSKNLEQPHIFFLFFLKYPPEKYIKEGGTNPNLVGTNFDKFVFRDIKWKEERKNKRTLFIAKPDELPGEELYSVNYLGGHGKAVKIRAGIGE